MYAANADIAKIAVTPADAGDLSIIESLYQQAPRGRDLAIDSAAALRQTRRTR